MSKQTTASARWEAMRAEAIRINNIERLCAQGRDYTFPAGQVQAGIQMATVEVPWLLAEIERLKAQLSERSKKPLTLVGEGL